VSQPTPRRDRELSRAELGQQEFDQAARWMRSDPRDRRLILRGLAVAVLLHVVVLFARLPAWGPDPVRVDAPLEQAMQVQFLKPPPPPPKVVETPKPKPKRIPRPDPTPDEPEPEPEPEPQPVEETSPEPAPAPVATGPVRVAPGQGPGLIKRVEPKYPPIAQAARLEGVVVLDAIILKDGTVGEIKVLRSAHAAFEQEAVNAIKQWRYTPSSQDVILTVTVNFTLRR